MNTINKFNHNKCRTCFNASKGLLSLFKMSTDEAKQQKSYAEMLKEVTNINIMHDKYSELPQVICGCCLRKLKAAHAFVQQAENVNDKFWSLLQEKNVKQLDCLQESQIDIKSCLEIKMEHDEVYNNKEESQQKDIQFKIEYADEEGTLNINTDLTKTNATQSEELIEKSITPKDCSDSKISNPCMKISDSEDNFADNSLQNVDMSESDYDKNDEYIPSDNSEWQEELEEVSRQNKKRVKNKNKLPRLKRRKGHHDPLENESINQIKNATTDDEMLPARCEECDKVFPNSRLLNRHRRGTHVPDELKIQCPHCVAKFSRRHNMYAHMRVVHKTKNLEEHQLKPKQLPKQHACLECSRCYTSKYKLLAHIKSQHNPESIPASSPEKVLNPKKRFLCTLCGLTFDSQSNLNIHYRRHTGEKPYKCDYCDRAYHRLYDAQVHRRSHTGEKPYQCTLCEKAFRRSNKLKIHMRTHTNERPYKCTQCEKAFKQSKDLNIHKRTHTGERPYKCSVCQSTFTQSNSLRLHQTKQKHFEVSIPAQESNLMYESLSILEENKII